MKNSFKILGLLMGVLALKSFANIGFMLVNHGAGSYLPVAFAHFFFMGAVALGLMTRSKISWGSAFVYIPYTFFKSVAVLGSNEEVLAPIYFANLGLTIFLSAILFGMLIQTADLFFMNEEKGLRRDFAIGTPIAPEQLAKAKKSSRNSRNRERENIL